jgi:hypothetical protein
MKSALRGVGFFLLLGLFSCGKNEPVENKGTNSDNLVSAKPCAKGTLYRSESSRYLVDVAWDVGPTSGGEDGLENKFCAAFYEFDASVAALGSREQANVDRSKLVTVQTLDGVKVTAWMPSMGHDTGSEKPRTTERSPGNFDISNIWLYMTGEWEIIVEGSSNGQVEKTKFKVNVID